MKIKRKHSKYSNYLPLNMRKIVESCTLDNKIIYKKLDLLSKKDSIC